MSLQILDENQTFNAGFQQKLRDWNLTEKGFDYNVIAVFGSQSTGKSTLLNKLFDTDFMVMNEENRQQTTKGLWINKVKDYDVLVMDVEGTDGRERGENQDFERKSALFSLATAEIIIINMWEHMVGLYNGANMGLLKTVFDVNVQLFQKEGSPKTLLFFVIRDFTGQVPLANLSNTLKNDLEKIWGSLKLPKGKENSKISDYFDFSFSALPHKLFQEENFNLACGYLKKRFLDKSDKENYLFSEKYKKNIPADGFSRFCGDIWETIVENKDLDIPSQQQLLAQYRCDEISRLETIKFQQKVQQIQTLLEHGKLYEKLGLQMDTIKTETLQSFDIDGSRYHRQVYEKVRLELQEKVEGVFKVFFVQHCRNLSKKGVAGITIDLKDNLSGVERKFMENLEKIRKKHLDFFLKGVKESKLLNVEWKSEELETEFIELIDEICDKVKMEAMEKMVKNLQKFVNENLTEPIEVIINESAPDMWMQVSTVFRQTLLESTEKLKSQSLGFQASLEEIELAALEMKKDAFELVLKTLTEECSEAKMIAKLRRVFEIEFKYDKEGVPRMWSPSDDIQQIFTTSNSKVETFITLFSQISSPPTSFQIQPEDNVTDYIDPKKFTLLSPLKLQVIRDRFKREADTMFIEAKRSLIQTEAKIPYWFVVLTIILGWNEFIAVVSNPMYFVMIALILGGGYFLWFTGMMGPFMQVIKVATGEVGRQVGDQIKDRGINLPFGNSTVGGEGGSDGGTRRKNVGSVEEIELKKMN